MKIVYADRGGVVSKNPPGWAIGPHDDIADGVIVRLNGDGTIDEVIVNRPMRFHLEQMDADQYWIGLSDAEGVEQHIMLTRVGKYIYPTVYQ